MKRDEWSKHIEDWKSSGREAADYGKQHGIDPKKLYWWSWFLRRERMPVVRTVKRTASAPAAGTALLPVKIRRAAAPIGSPAQATAVSVSVEISLPDGAVIRAPSSVDPMWLGRVVASAVGAC